MSEAPNQSLQLSEEFLTILQGNPLLLFGLYEAQRGDDGKSYSQSHVGLHECFRKNLMHIILNEGHTKEQHMDMAKEIAEQAYKHIYTELMQEYTNLTAIIQRNIDAATTGKAT